ncbi:MAG: hypothetical protein SP1CHLAM54_16310 [Chlamydiia bacterium]|nr:hypothetical protein [Chlamydiia bacterium]MCH9616520.1 hypothetical protein [Chlamydiia bacterium]
MRGEAAASLVWCELRAQQAMVEATAVHKAPPSPERAKIRHSHLKNGR